jgi:hypothetical protein
MKSVTEEATLSRLDLIRPLEPLPEPGFGL